MTTLTETVQAAVLYNPKQANSKIQDAKPEMFASMTINGEKKQVYWIAGGICDYLRQGDTIAVEWLKGKWRICSSQAETLKETLRRRSSAAPAAPTDAPTATTHNGDDVDQMAAIAQRLAAALPEWTEQAIASLSCTVFISRSKR